MSENKVISADGGTPAGPDRSHWRTEFVAMCKLAVPLALAQIANIALNTTDVVMMGWLGPKHLAAGTLAANLIFPCMLFSIGILTATGAIMAQELGGRQYKGVRRTVRQGFWVILMIFLPVGTFLWFGQDVLLLLGQEAITSAMAEGYLRTALWSVPPALGFIVIRNFIAAHERPRPAVVIAVVGILVNAALDYVLIFGKFGFPRLELVGAGIATTLVHVVMFAAMIGLTLTDRRYKRYFLYVRFWRSDWPRFREILSIGVPIGFTILAEAGLFAASGLLIGLLGSDALAGHAVALQCTAIAFMVPLGISQAATVRVGRAIGAGHPELVAAAGWSAIIVALIFVLLPAGLFIFLPDQLVGLFLGTRTPLNDAAFGFAVSFLWVAAFFQLADGAQVVALGALRGMKDTRVPLVMAVICYWPVGFGVAVGLGFWAGLGGVGVWLGLAVALTVVGVALSWRFHLNTRKLASA